MNDMSVFAAPIAETIWDLKYRFKDVDGTPHDQSIQDTWRRVARALSAPEKDPAKWEHEFYSALEGFKFLPAGRILAGAGTKRQVTLFNCFVMGQVPDSIEGIFDALKEAAQTMQQGGGIGYDFSTLRPRGAKVDGVGADASGPLSFMDVWDAMCRTIMSAGSRRGAMMGVLRCDHPDILEFIAAKADPARLRMFNMSVLITDAFMAALQADDPWALVFDGKTYDRLPARALWAKIMQATYDVAEPGVIFVDRINQTNNLRYCETIAATNPCGEQPLPPYGACLLGSVNLARLVQHPFDAQAGIDLPALERLVAVAVRMLDNVIDVSGFPLAAQAAEARAKRRIGLGVTGLADALLMVGLRYGSAEAARQTEHWLQAIARAAYLASANLAREKGAFPLFERAPMLDGKIVQALGPEVTKAIAADGLRNAVLTSVAPTGTISLLAGNVSSGVEPIFADRYHRKLMQPAGERSDTEVLDYAVQMWRKLRGDVPLPDYFVDAQTLTPQEHIAMQAAAQTWVDASISKTINCPADIAFTAFKDVYWQAWMQGCKGCTTYRPNATTGAVLSAGIPPASLDMGTPLPRPNSLEGSTYKINWPGSEHALYITINDLLTQAGRRPFEIFINSKNMEHFAWTVALTRMVSAIFRRGGDVSFVVEELKAVFDPRGGAWVAGKYIPSILAAIGGVIEEHMIATGFLTGKTGGLNTAPGASCPHCGQQDLRMQEGCTTCDICGFSECSG